MNKKESGEELMHCMNQFRLINKKYHIHLELPPAEFFMMVSICKIAAQNEKKEIPIKGATTTQIVKHLGTTLSAASKLIKNLEEKKLVERIANPSDRRVTFLRLSEKGEELLHSERERRELIMSRLIERIGDDDINHLIQTLHKMYEYLKEELEEYND